MIESLRSRFRGRFIKTAEKRLEQGLKSLGEDDGAKRVRTELHSLAGEASMLGFVEIADIARRGEEAARRWEAAADPSGRVHASRAIRTLRRMLSALEREIPATDELAVAVTHETGKRIRILIIDDSEISSEQVAEALADDGFEVETAAAVDEALAALERFDPRIVLADVNMPGVDLEDLCRDLRRASSSTSIVLVSALSEEELSVRAAGAGADGFISKTRGIGGILDGVQSKLVEIGS